MNTVLSLYRDASSSQAFKSRLVVVALGTAMALAALAAAILLETGASRSIALSIAVAAAPLGLYLSIRRPLIFPFALYTILVPFSELVFISGMGTLTKLVGGLAIVALVFYMLRTRRTVRPPAALFAWLALIAWACTSIFWAIDTNLSLSLIGTLLQLFLMFAVVAVVPVTAFELRAILAAVTIGGVCAAAYGAYLFKQGADIQGNRIVLESVTSSQTLDPNHFAASLLLPLSLAMMGALRTRGFWRKVLFLGLFGVLMLGVYASGSRGGFVGVAAVILYLLWKSRYRLQILLVGLVAGAASALVPTSLWARIISDPTSGSGRTGIWMIGAAAFRHYWLLGAGIANFPNAYNQSFLRVHPVLSLDWYWDRAPHDILLMIGVELGIVGLALFAWAVVAQFRTLRHVRLTHPLYDVRLALEGAFVGLMVAALFLDVMYWKYAWLVFMAMVLARSAALCSSPSVEASHIQPAPRPDAGNGVLQRSVIRA